MSLPSPPALGGPLGDALAGAEPAAAQQLQQLAAPGTDAAAKAAALQAEAEQAPQAQAAAASSDASGAAEAATANATKDLGNDFSCVAPVGTPGVPCACGECIKKAIDPAAPSLSSVPGVPALPSF